jgi:competence protein ComFC
LFWKYHLSQWIWGSLDLLFPPNCGGCNRVGFRWCPDCQQKVQFIKELLCKVGGLPLVRTGFCPGCTEFHPSYKIMRSWPVFEGPIRLALHNLKYYRNLVLGDSLARQLISFARGFGWPIDAVVPVPLGKKRLQERGYNQVGMVAMPLAALGDWEYSPTALIRTRETRSQVGLSPFERRENVNGAFRGIPGKISGKSVLLIDDVATTGATISASSDALLESGAKDIYAVTLALALPRHGLKAV